MDQETVWVNGEGDNWFLRNKATLNSWQAENDLPLQLIKMFRIVPKKALEVGCANGYRLVAIAQQYGASCYGVDPSAEAIQDGKHRYPFIHLSRGVASELPFQDGEFDLVVINFVFHWLAREKLLRAVSEIDRVLKWDGYLIIGDFSPANPCKVRYHHLLDDDVWTYKQDYSKLFCSSRLYHIVGEVIGSHSSGKISAEAASDERTGVFILQKAVEYEEVKLKS